MKRALSLADGADWDAREYGAKEARWRNEQRGRLVCMGCGQPAMFKAGTRRRNPFFAAKHSQNCPLRKQAWSACRYLQ